MTTIDIDLEVINAVDISDNLMAVNSIIDTTDALDSEQVDNEQFSAIIPMKDFNITGKSKDNTIKLCISVLNYRHLMSTKKFFIF